MNTRNSERLKQGRGRLNGRLRLLWFWLLLGLLHSLVSWAASADPFESHLVSWSAAGVTVEGTLTGPVHGEGVPGVLLIAGSGPTDRDWNSEGLSGQNGSGRLLAEALSARGIVVLRYDKRGTGQTQAHPPHRWEDYTAEQQGGLEFLSKTGQVDPRRIYVLGHSEGALHALQLSQRTNIQLAGVGLLAAPGRRLDQLIEAQFLSAHRAAGITPAPQHVELLAAMLASMRSNSDGPPAQVLESRLLSGLARALFDPTERFFLADLIDFDPLEATARLKIPLLLMGGGKDIQTDDEFDLGPLIEAAQAGTSPRVRVYRLPASDHMLKHERRPRSLIQKVGRAPAYNEPTRSLDSAVVPALVDWIRTQPTKWAALSP